jgi:hypothetical protein
LIIGMFLSLGHEMAEQDQMKATGAVANPQ